MKPLHLRPPDSNHKRLAYSNAEQSQTVGPDLLLLLLLFATPPLDFVLGPRLAPPYPSLSAGPLPNVQQELWIGLAIRSLSSGVLLDFYKSLLVSDASAEHFNFFVRSPSLK